MNYSHQFATTCRASFARHETFHPRFGWLKKAYDEANHSTGADFAATDAPVRLGVGKNMVHAIRYWGLAFKVLQEQPNPDRPRLPLIAPTPFGRALLDDDGWDPYLERPESLWLLHWQLLRPACTAPTWWAAFNALPTWGFTEQELHRATADLVEDAGWGHVVAASIKKDVDCLIRTYTVKGHGRQTLDDILDCPFRELGLIERRPDTADSWRVVSGRKPSLTPLVLLYTCLDFVAEVAPSDRSISLARLANEPGSPGRALGLSEADIHFMLQEVVRGRRDLEVAEPGGLRQLLLHVDRLPHISERILSQIFNGRLARLSA